MRAPYALAGLVCLLAAGAIAVPAAEAAIPFAPCGSTGFGCGEWDWSSREAMSGRGGRLRLGGGVSSSSGTMARSSQLIS